LQHYLGVIEHYCRAGSTGALVLPTATAAEGLANLAFSAGAEFQGNLRHVSVLSKNYAHYLQLIILL
jgi:hypothetical protein